MSSKAKQWGALGCLLAAAALAGCAEPQRASEVAQPEGWDADLALPIPVDLNPDPRVLEIDLEARVENIEFLPGKQTPAWTYNGTVPGPLLKTQVGDTVIVNFKNSLPEATTIHWHGLRVPNDMDGAPGMTQPPVEPGGTFRYEFVVRDAGTYWYHPHSDSAAQVGRGLYGAILVEDPDDPEAFGDDLVLVLSDMSLDDEGQLLPADSGGGFGDLFGREGSTLLVNGKVLPRLKVRAGKQQRWRIINAARARYYNIRMRDHRFYKLGGDSGLAARSADVYNVIVTPGERVDAVFTPASEPGTVDVLRWVPTERGYGSLFARSQEDMLTIETVDLPAVVPEPIPLDLRTIEPIDIAGAAEHRLELTIAIQPNDVTMGINGIPYWRAEAMEATIGEKHVWHVVNNTDFAHPFHLHGYFFQVLDDARIPEWKDTVNVPAHSDLKIAIDFDERPGMWMYHCHILDHAEVGMMGHLHVREPGATVGSDSGTAPVHTGHHPPDG